MEQINTFDLLVAREKLEGLKAAVAALVDHPEAGSIIQLLNALETALDQADQLADILGSKIAPMPWWHDFAWKPGTGSPE
ncbi:hypothetical protein ACFQU7_33430 [Pseudoroseomonas wenyumeiae]